MRRTLPPIQILARLALGAGLMPYAVSKLMQAQFQVSPFEYTRPLGEIPGTILTWAFLGHTPWFQMLLGAAEFIPAVMLFVRPVQTLGALLMFPVLLNVVLFNYAMNLWPDTKVISAVLLGIDVLLLVTEAPKLRPILRVLRESPSSSWLPVQRRAESIGMALFLTVVIAASYLLVEMNVARVDDRMRDFVGVRQINGAGSFTVESFLVDGKSILPDSTSIYFTIWRDCHWIAGQERKTCRFDADRNAGTFRIQSLNVGDSDAEIAGTYRALQESVFLSATRAGKQVEIELRKQRAWQ